MLALEVQIGFAEVLVKFKEKRATVSDLSKLIEVVRRYKKEIPDDVKLVILSIPALVLRENCELKSRAIEWASEEGDYFSGNCTELESWKAKFMSKSFDLHDMSDFLEYILADSDRLNSDFYLRNPEVTLRDDVRLKYKENFENEQIIYAMVLERVLMM